MGLIQKLMPSRSEHTPVKVIADLDALISQPIGFKYLGKDFIIDPMTTENFIQITKALHDMEVALKADGMDQDAIYLTYYNFIHALCKSITLSDIKKAALPQLHALMALLIKHIKGETGQEMVDAPETFDEAQKKKMRY